MTQIATQSAGGELAAPPGIPPGAPPSAGSPAAPAIVDVWSRTAPKYRRRAAVLLAVTLGLFIGLCVFTHWLRVARPFDFSWSSYAEPARFWGPRTQSLNDFLRYPISVEQAPLHGVVLGLLLASIVAVPILVAILYRIGAAIPFVLSVLIFAHLPWMSVTLLAGCVLASVRPFRLSFRYGSALLGLLPVLLYLYLATWSTPEQPGLPVAPAERTLLIAPWVLAILSACAMMAAVLLIARVVNYRPGAIAPVMAVTFATPAVIFFRYVGRDELEYRVLEATYGPRAERFLAPRSAPDTIRAWFRDGSENLDEELLAVWAEPPRVHEFVVRRMWQDFLADRNATWAECNRFISAHPDSRYVPCVLYIQARTLDARLDEPKLTRSARRELYTDFPHAQSAPAWAALLSQFPDSPLATAARLRLAQLRLRAGEVEAARQLLEPAPRAGAPPPTATQPARPRLFQPPEAESSLQFDPAPFEFEIRRLRELIDANRSDPRHGDAPLIEWSALDRHRAGYDRQLLALAARYPGALLYDNLMVAWAVARPDATARYAALLACLDPLGDGDALPEALYHLADLEIQTLAGADDPIRGAGIARMRDVARRFPATCWGDKARERLEMLDPAYASVAGAGAPP